MGTLIMLWCLVVAVVSFSRAMKARAKEQRELEILKNHPTSWKQMKEFELAKTERNRAGIWKAVLAIVPIFFKK
jgi:hypothetical protein